MRALLLVALTSVADARPVAQDSADWAREHFDANAFGDTLELGAVHFIEPACNDHFTPVDDVPADQRAYLVACLTAPQQIYTLGGRVVALFGDSVAVELKFRRGRIVKLGPVGGGKQFTIDAGPDARFAPSKRVAAAIDEAGSGDVEAVYKLCHDAAGKVTSRHALVTSGNAAFDREAESYAWTWKPTVPDAVCELVSLRYPLVDPTTGLDAGDIPHDTVSASALMDRHIAGDKHIEPDDVTKTEIMRSGKDKVIAQYDLCIDVRGDVVGVGMTKSSGFSAFDAKLAAGMRTWRFRPFAATTCAPLTFIYAQY